MLTTSASDEDMLEAYKSVNAYIRKPVSVDRFIAVVDSIDHFWLGVVALPGGRL